MIIYIDLYESLNVLGIEEVHEYTSCSVLKMVKLGLQLDLLLLQTQKCFLIEYCS